MVAAVVEDTDTTATPGATPNSSPAVMVSGTAGSASTSSAVYSPPYAAYLRMCAHVQAVTSMFYRSDISSLTLSHVTPVHLSLQFVLFCAHQEPCTHHVFTRCL